MAILGDVRTGDRFVGKKSGTECICVNHCPKSGKGVWAVKVVLTQSDEFYTVYDSHDVWNNEVLILEKGLDVSKYQHL